MDIRAFDSNVVPDALLRLKTTRSTLASRDLVALSGGHDFLLQASNLMCAETSFGALKLPWLAGQLDAAALASLRTGGTSFTSSILEQAVAAPLLTTGPVDVLILFAVHDVLFDAADQCRVRASARVALGNLLVVPKEPGLVHGLLPGEAVEQIGDVASRIGEMVATRGIAAGRQALAMRTLSDIRPGLLGDRGMLERAGGVFHADLDRHIDLGNRTSFEVSAWLGDGLLEIPGSFAATADRPSASIGVSMDVSNSTAHYTHLTHDAAMLLSDADPLGLVLLTTQRVRQRTRLPLVDDLSLVGGPSDAIVNHLDALDVDAFPCGANACALNVGATIIPGRVAAHSTIDFIGSSRYGVVWSADAVRILVRFCWETSLFPRSIMQTQTGAIRLKIDGIEQLADAISEFHLDTLDAIELQYDSNGRQDILYTSGLARVVPRLIRLNDGRELTPKDPNDKLFAPSQPTPWAALGELTEEPLPASSPDLVLFESGVSRGVTARLGRPFTEPSDSVQVTDSRLSAPAQRIALLIT